MASKVKCPNDGAQGHAARRDRRRQDVAGPPPRRSTSSNSTTSRRSASTFTATTCRRARRHATDDADHLGHRRQFRRRHLPPHLHEGSGRGADHRRHEPRADARHHGQTRRRVSPRPSRAAMPASSSTRPTSSPTRTQPCSAALTARHYPHQNQRKDRKQCRKAFIDTADTIARRGNLNPSAAPHRGQLIEAHRLGRGFGIYGVVWLSRELHRRSAHSAASSISSRSGGR